jgi:hypothetical protein
MAKKTHCHWLIAKTAKEMAGAQYEELARNDAWYRTHPSQKDFIAAYWSKYTETARATLAKMLALNFSESIKEQIADALILDDGYAKGRRSVMLPNIITSEQADAMGIRH